MKQKVLLTVRILRGVSENNRRKRGLLYPNCTKDLRAATSSIASSARKAVRPFAICRSRLLSSAFPSRLPASGSISLDPDPRAPLHQRRSPAGPQSWVQGSAGSAMVMLTIPGSPGLAFEMLLLLKIMPNSSSSAFLSRTRHDAWVEFFVVLSPCFIPLIASPRTCFVGPYPWLSAE